MNPLEVHRKQVLDRLLRIILILGLVAYIPSLYVSIALGLYYLVVINSLGYLLIIAAMIHPRSNYRIKLAVTVITTLTIGAAVIFFTGTEGAGHLWLLFAVVISALFGKRHIIILSIAFSLAALVLSHFFGRWGINKQETAGLAAFAIGANFTLIAIVLSTLIYQLFQFLRDELYEKEQLLRLLHHRVKNNLQLVQSLISLNDDGTSAHEGFRILDRQVAAISHANELVLHSPEYEILQAADLFGSLIRPGKDRLEGEAVLRLSPERITELAVGFIELVEKAGSRGGLRVLIGEGETGDSCIIRISRPAPLPDESELREITETSLLPSEVITVEPDNSGLIMHIRF